MSRLVSQQMDEMDDDDDGARPLAESLLLAIADLLFCPEFTVQSHKRGGPVSNLSESLYHVYLASLLSCSWLNPLKFLVQFIFLLFIPLKDYRLTGPVVWGSSRSILDMYQGEWLIIFTLTWTSATDAMSSFLVHSAFCCCCMRVGFLTVRKLLIYSGTSGHDHNLFQNSGRDPNIIFP